MLSQGKFKAYATDAGLSQDSKGNPQVFIVFDVNHEDGSTDTITYYGSLNETAKPGKKAMADITIEALYAAGYVGNDLEGLKLPFIQSFSPQACSVEIENHEYNGKTSLRVKWVNPLRKGPKAYEGALPSLAGRFAKVRAGMGSKAPAPAAAKDDWGV